MGYDPSSELVSVVILAFFAFLGCTVVLYIVDLVCFLLGELLECLADLGDIIGDYAVRQWERYKRRRMFQVMARRQGSTGQTRETELVTIPIPESTGAP